jgi:hypothetical protein
MGYNIPTNLVFYPTNKKEFGMNELWPILVAGFLFAVAVAICYMYYQTRPHRQRHMALSQAYSEYGMHGLRNSQFAKEVVQVGGYIDWAVRSMQEGHYVQKFGIITPEGHTYITTNYSDAPFSSSTSGLISEPLINVTGIFTLIKVKKDHKVPWQSEFALVECRL